MNLDSTERVSVTVVVPSFESNDTLPAALHSLDAQTVPHRTIVVDDGSTTPVTDAVETGAALVLRQANRGVAAARNLGIEHADTEFVAFLDADDLWDPTYLERQLHHLDVLPGIAGVICAPHPPHEEHYRGRHVVEFLPTLRSLRGGPGTSAWCFRRGPLLEVGGFDTEFRRMQDYELLIRMTGMGYSVLRHDEPLYRYRPSIERGNRYGSAHQRALERFAERYGSDDVERWISLRLDPGQRRSVRALMSARAMNVAALRGAHREVRALARVANQARQDLPRARRVQVAAASRAPRLYSRVVRRRRGATS